MNDGTTITDAELDEYLAQQDEPEPEELDEWYPHWFDPDERTRPA